MSNLKEAYLLSEYKIDEKDKNMKIKINKFKAFKKKGVLYSALYELENLILPDGTSEKYKNIFLNFIIDNFEDLLKEINKLKSILLKEEDYENYNPDSIRDLNKYDFYYLRECFDKYEITLNNQHLKIIFNKKKIYNENVIKNNPKIKKEYNNLVKNIDSNDDKISADNIHIIINNLNEKIN